MPSPAWLSRLLRRRLLRRRLLRRRPPYLALVLARRVLVRVQRTTVVVPGLQRAVRSMTSHTAFRSASLEIRHYGGARVQAGAGPGRDVIRQSHALLTERVLGFRPEAARALTPGPVLHGARVARGTAGTAREQVRIAKTLPALVHLAPAPARPAAAARPEPAEERARIHHLEDAVLPTLLPPALATAPPPPPLPAEAVERIADRVMDRIERRALAQRERLGR